MNLNADNITFTEHRNGN